MRARGAGLSDLRVNTWAWVLRSGPKANFVTFNTWRGGCDRHFNGVKYYS